MRIRIVTIIVLFFWHCFSTCCQGQIRNSVKEFKQAVKGQVLDASLHLPLSRATVRLTELNEETVADSLGNFRFYDVPVGRYSIVVTHIGYQPLLLDNVSVNSGKETSLSIGMESTDAKSDEVIIKTTARRNKPLNEMVQLSATSFTTEETQKYAAAVNDPLRMAASFPGISALDDGKNDIVIRGNSPQGLLWRMEGVDIPNPNHFGSIGSTGGTISILSAQLLASSDFLTDAFPAEYGNVLSGVFDLNLRKGNTDKQEYSLDAGLLGLGIAAEGPFDSSYRGSYLVNYRYSTLAILNNLGLHIYSGASHFQDLSYNISLPSKIGNFTLFGFGGLSSNRQDPYRDSLAWRYLGDNTRYGEEFISNTAVAGVTHLVSLSERTSLKSAAAYSYQDLENITNYVKDDYSLTNVSKDNYITRRLQLTTNLNHRFSPISEGRFGVRSDFIFYNFLKNETQNVNFPPTPSLNGMGTTQTIQAFGEWRFQPARRLSLVPGLHYFYLTLNQTSAAEPRASVKWNITNKSAFSFGFALLSQMQPLGTYFGVTKDGSGNPIYANRNLGLTRSAHYVLAFDHELAINLHLKAELYYQKLFDVPVSLKDSTVSILNMDENYITDPLTNQGKGENYGAELSITRHLSNHLYYLVSTSLFQSKYRALDNIERNTRFNQNYINTLTIGKEFPWRDKPTVFAANGKIIHAGGLRDVPIDPEKSKQLGHPYYIKSQSYNLQYPDYLRIDLRLSMKWNRPKRTNTLSLDVQNLTNRRNLRNQFFIASTQTFLNNYQNGLIPVVNYKVEF